KVVARILQSDLNAGDYLVGQQITVCVDRPIIVVVTIKWIIAPSGIPIARIQKIISTGDKNDGVAMLPPPIAIVPFVPITTECIRIAKSILRILLIPLRCVLPGFAVG